MTRVVPHFSAANVPQDTNFSYLLVVLISFLAFRGLYFLGKATFTLPPGLSSKKEWLYLNTLISFIHACISSVWSIFCFYHKPSMLTDLMRSDQLRSEWSLPSTCLLAFLIGYTAHDTWDIVVNDFKGSPGLVVHHIVIISVTIFVLHTKQYLSIATCLCFVEINSVFLHLRRLMRFHGWNSSHLAYKLNCGVLFITFIALRFIFLLCLSAYFIFKRQKMPLSHFLIGTFGFAALIIINLILFPRLWRSEFVIKKSQSNGHMNGFVAEKVN